MKIKLTILIIFGLILGSVVSAAPTSTILQNLYITGLKSSGYCLSIGATGLVATSTCGSASATTTINSVSGPTFTFATSTDTNLGLLISGSTAQLGFTPVWIGTLADSRITSAGTWNAKQNAISFPISVASTSLTGGVGLTLTGNDMACDTASGSVFGCLTAANWSTFNSKEDTLTFNSGLTRTGNTIGNAGVLSLNSATGSLTMATSTGTNFHLGVSGGTLTYYFPSFLDGIISTSTLYTSAGFSNPISYHSATTSQAIDLGLNDSAYRAGSSVTQGFTSFATTTSGGGFTAASTTNTLTIKFPSFLDPVISTSTLYTAAGFSSPISYHSATSSQATDLSLGSLAYRTNYVSNFSGILNNIIIATSSAGTNFNYSTSSQTATFNFPNYLAGVISTSTAATAFGTQNIAFHSASSSIKTDVGITNDIPYHTATSSLWADLGISNNVVAHTATTSQAVDLGLNDSAYRAGGGTLTGTGQANYIPKWTSATALATTTISETNSTTTIAGDLIVNKITGTTINGLSLGLGANSVSTNVGVGAGTLEFNTTGAQNTAIGNYALAGNSSGTQNMANGYFSLYSNQTGSNNIGIGTFSLLNSISGSNNIAIGYYAGGYQGGSNTFYVNNINQSNTANDKAYSLLYGTFAGTAATTTGQTLTINASATIALDLNLPTITNSYLGVNGSGKVIATTTPLTSATATSSKSITVETPTASDNITIFTTHYPITINRVGCINNPVSGNSTTFNLMHHTARGTTATTTAVFASNKVCTSTSTPTYWVAADFQDATMASDEVLWMTTSSASSTAISITIDYLYDN